MELTPGTVIDRYTVDSVLGEGGMAVVYRVRHNQLGTVHALKVLSLTNRSIRERLVQEGRVQAQLGHPNVVSVTDVIDVGGAPGLLMEYVRGPDLDALLSRQRLSLEQADALAQDIIGAVVAAHRQQIIHRDLKPANIILLITPEGLVPKITDFGLAKLLDDEGPAKTRTGATMGTPHYMSPEQIRDAKNVGPEADVFSLGAILYELVCGERAFQGASLYEVFKAVSEGLYAPPRQLVSDLPTRMEAAIIGALQIDLALRIPTVERLLAVWKGEMEAGQDLVIPTAGQPGPWTEDIMAEALSLSGGEEEQSARPPSDPTFASFSPEPPASDSLAASDGSPRPPSEAPPSVPSFAEAPPPPPHEQEAERSGRGWLVGLLAAGGGLSPGVFVLALVVGAVLLLSPRAPAPSPAQAPVTVAAAPTPAPAQEEALPPLPAPGHAEAPPSTPAPSREEALPPIPAPGQEEAPPLEASRPAPPLAQPPSEGQPVPAAPAEPEASGTAEAEVVEDLVGGEEVIAPVVPSETAFTLPPGLDPEQTPKGAKRIDALVTLERDPEATAIIGHVMKNDPDPEVRRKAWRVVRARHRVGTGSQAEHEELLLWVIDHGPLPVRREALLAMGRNGTRLEPISAACHSTQVAMRGVGLRALGAFGRQNPDRRGEVVALLEARQALETDPALGAVIQELLDE